MLKNIHKFCIRLAQPDIMFYTLPWMMILLVAGTIAQREIGLYQADQMFFSSWIIWFGIIPLPGGLLTLSLIFINLLAKFIFKSNWSWQRSGTIITHFGILLLFVGAIFTALTAREGFLLIPEGRSENKVLDYHIKRLYIFENEQEIASYSVEELQSGALETSTDIPFHINILNSCKNCEFLQNKETNPERKGLAAKITLAATTPNKQEEANLSGATLRISGTDGQDGVYVSTEAAPHPIMAEKGGKQYRVQFQRMETRLPFQVQLNDFVKEMHPGTETAKSFHSDIELIDHGATWPVRIGMNDPLRYKGYTFFQSSFTNTPIGEATILAVVKNTGWLFPYIASAIIALGLLLHLGIRFRSRYE